VGESFNIMAFVVVVLGGMGNFVGALFGGFIVGLAESLGATLLPGSLKQVVVFAIFVLVLLFRPRGFSEADVAAETLGGLVLGALVVAPPFLPPYFLEILISVMLFGYLGTAWNILGGYAGQFSFGHAAYFGIGAYTSTLLFLRFGMTPWLGMLAGGVLATAFGLGAGYLSFRSGLRGPYFSLVTPAFAEMLRVIAVNTRAVGSSLGLVIPNREPAPANFVFAGKLAYYYVILAMALAAVWITWRVARSKL